MKRILLVCHAVVALSACSVFQRHNVTETAKTVKVAENSPKDTIAGKLKPYSEVINGKAQTKRGLITIHQVDDKWFFEISNQLMGKDLLVVNRISKAPTFVGFGGDQIGESIIQFVKGPSDKLFIKRMSFNMRSDDSSGNSMWRSVANSNFQPLVAVFNIKALSPDSSAVVIDMTDYLNSDNDVFFFANILKSSLGYDLEGYLQDKSYVSTIHSYPVNLEIKTVKTYTRRALPFTFELNSSLVLLPEQPMKPRFLDQRVGFFAKGYMGFTPDKPVEVKWMINRWKLEPKPEDLEKYKKGELVEPAKQIVYYIDPATPKVWVPYLIQGVNDWQKAFEKAGFKNAIIAKEVTGKDSTWSLEDARHSVIVYKASNAANASGPQIHDPRSGEILESHINWYHNVQELIHDWYMIQAGATDRRAQKMQFDDELMGRLIRYVCAHEVGHTLGLRHNYFSSSTVPVDSLRNARYVKTHGHCPSIMDYARFNYVAQPEDKIDPADLVPGIGEYDKWAINWGYRYFDEFKTSEDEIESLEKWVTQMLTQDKSLVFGTETHPMYNLDPKRQSEDLGDNAMKAGYYGIQNLKRIYPKLKEWTNTPSGNLENNRRMVKMLWLQYYTYLNHVATNIGGVMWTDRYKNEQGMSVTYPSRQQQQNAIRFLQEELFQTPLWLLDTEIYNSLALDPAYIDFPGYMHSLSIYQRTILYRIISHKITNSLLVAQTTSSDGSYSVDELFTDLEKGIWSELKTGKNIDIYRRNLQKHYIERMTELINGYNGSPFPLDKETYPVITITDIYPVIKDHLRTLQKEVEAAIPKSTDRLSKLHLIEIKDRIRKAFNPLQGSQVTVSGENKTTGFTNEFSRNKMLYGPENNFNIEGRRDCWELYSPFDR